MRLRLFVVRTKKFVKESEELAIVQEIIVYVLNNKVDFARLLKQFKESNKSIGRNFKGSFAVLFITAVEELCQQNHS
jgi:hypothetical protein